MSEYTFREFRIPRRMMSGIELYINEHIQPGDFLTAVIDNDLRAAVGYADDENIANLPAFVAYFWNEAPVRCWVSPERRKEWLSHEGR